MCVYHPILPGKIRGMYSKCPRCRERAVLERELARFLWERYCTECGFKFTIKAQETDWEPDDPQLNLAF